MEQVRPLKKMSWLLGNFLALETDWVVIIPGSENVARYVKT